MPIFLANCFDLRFKIDIVVMIIWSNVIIINSVLTLQVSTASLPHNRKPCEIEVVSNHTCSLHTCVCAGLHRVRVRLCGLINGRNQFNSWGSPQVPHSGPGLCQTTVINLKPKGLKWLRQSNIGAYLIKKQKIKYWKYVQILAARLNQADWKILTASLLVRLWKPESMLPAVYPYAYYRRLYARTGWFCTQLMELVKYKCTYIMYSQLTPWERQPW